MASGLHSVLGPVLLTGGDDKHLLIWRVDEGGEHAT